MRELRWPLLVAVICLPIAVLAAGWKLPWLADPTPTAAPLGVPTGDREVAWIHTTVNANTWERFVTGVMRTQMTVPGLHVEDSRAFLDSTTAVPELVLRRDGHAGAVRIRWYKLQNQVTTADWVRALAARTPAPLAVIGGGSTDRAIDLARAMAAQEVWHGDRPPLLVTTATADFADPGEVMGPTPVRLADVYDDRTFRFCFTNRQMAEAVVGFVAQQPDVRPRPGEPDVPIAVLSVYWEDDRYSVDLQEQFTEAVNRRWQADGGVRFAGQWKIPFSVGGVVTPNVHEATVGRDIARQLAEMPDRRVMLVLPGITLPARRLLQAVVEAYPAAADKLVAVTGDGIPVNAILRDGEFAWPVAALPVPLVLFTHHDPAAWDTPAARPAPPPGYEFRRPNSTEEAMHFGELGKVLAEECFPKSGAAPARGDDLITRLKARAPAMFDANGERLGGGGEYVVFVRPRPDPLLTVWRNEDGKTWVQKRAVPFTARGPAAAEGRP